jgi:hypothetical protein
MRLLLIGIAILMISCKAKYVVINDIKPTFRADSERQIPKISDNKIVDSFFKTWSKKSEPITQIEFEQLDSLIQFGYEIYENLIIDTTFIGINPSHINSKYILLPNTFTIGYADNYRYEANIVFYDRLLSENIKDFRPRISFSNKQILYYTQKYQDTLPKFAEKYGVGGFIDIDKYAYLMSNIPRYYETTPVIRSVIKIKNTNEFCIDYDYRSRSYETIIKKENDKWIKIKDLTILEHD